MLRLDALMHSVNDADPRYLAFSHLQWMDELVRRRFATAHFTSFFIGGGGYTLPRTWLDRNPLNDLTIAELDPLVTSIASSQMWFSPGPATTILHMDARLALARLPEGRTFDVIVGDAFRDIALPAHLITDEFHQLVRQRLAANGFYVLNVIDAVQSRRLVGSVIQTLRRRFEVIEVWYDTAAYQTSDAINFIIYASSRPSGLSNPLVSRAAPATRWARFASAAIDDVPGAIVLTDDLAPVERLLAR